MHDLRKLSGQSAVLHVQCTTGNTGGGEGGRLGRVCRRWHMMQGVCCGCTTRPPVPLSLREEFSGDSEKKVVKLQFL